MSINNTLKNIFGDTYFLKLQKLKQIFFPTKFDNKQKANFDNQAAFYKQLIKPNSLCFDIGANIGLKSKIFLQLGAKVVAVEPQASCVAILQREIGNKATIVAKGVGATSEVKDFYVSTNFELSSFNKEWINTLPVEEYGDTQIKQVEKIEIITLDNLIKQYGKPDFIKIDVEGFEIEVLKGLNEHFNTLSFEFFVSQSTNELLQCLDILQSKFNGLSVNFTNGNVSSKFNLDKWISLNDFINYVKNTNFKSMIAGDIYVKMN